MFQKAARAWRSIPLRKMRLDVVIGVSLDFVYCLYNKKYEIFIV